MRETEIESLTILLDRLEVECHIGVGEEERAEPQRLHLTLRLEVQAPQGTDGRFSDEIHEVLDYAGVRTMARETCRANHFKLLESLADLIARRCLEDPRVLSVELTLTKPDIFSDCEAAGVQLIRQVTPSGPAAT